VWSFTKNFFPSAIISNMAIFYSAVSIPTATLTAGAVLLRLNLFTAKATTLLPFPWY
jgi:hypothetical protein